MRLLRNLLDKQHALYAKGGKLEKLYPLYEAIDAFLFTTGSKARRAPYVRDAVDLKRLMITVCVALVPAILMALYNTGLQANIAITGGAAPYGWQGALIAASGLGFSPDDILACCVHGLLYYLPVLIVTFAVGGAWEVLFAVVRKHEVNEGFLVTGMLFPMILPPTIPLWQVALGISFGVVVAKELFGGTGFNVLNPALVGRAFLFFAYPVQISGNAVWVAADGFTMATPLAVAHESGLAALAGASDSLWNTFIGLEPGSMGETSALAIGLGALILLITGVGSWRIMVSIALGTMAMSLLVNAVGPAGNSMASLPFYWHMAMGGWAFGAVFMATDPVSAAQSNTGRFVYGFLIGVLVVLIRVFNPAYPEGMMLAILLMNVFAPLIDHAVVRAHIKRRRARYV
jgi:Na+-transporting NADH:ubiquinone oxidoreductase subunit B